MFYLLILIFFIIPSAYLYTNNQFDNNEVTLTALFIILLGFTLVILYKNKNNEKVQKWISTYF